MSMETYINGMDTGATEPASQPIQVSETAAVDKDSDKVQTSQEQKDDKQGQEEKDPTLKSIDAAVSDLNNKMRTTRCEYLYDEPTKRVSIKVFDKDTDELIREIPPEKSLEAIKKIWELAGLIVDKKL